MNKDARDKVVDASDSNTIMVVEPDVLARMILADYLRDCGYKVVAGGDAQDVFDMLAAGEKIDIVIDVFGVGDGVKSGDRIAVRGVFGREQTIGNAHLIHIGITSKGQEAGLLIFPAETTHANLARRFHYRHLYERAALCRRLGVEAYTDA